MENEEAVLEPQVETEAVTETTEVDATQLIEQLEKEKEARRQVNARAKEAEARAKAAEEKLKNVSNPGLDVSDYIDISAALDGLDAREKARLAEEHKLSGRPLKDIREGEDYQLWQSAYRAKLEKENALKPSATQAVEEGPKPLHQRLANASLAEKEEILRELNLYKENRPRADRVTIGNIRPR